MREWGPCRKPPIALLGTEALAATKQKTYIHLLCVVFEIVE